MKDIPSLLNQAAERLHKAGIDQPRLLAELLLAHAEGIDRGHLLARDEAAAPGYEALVEQAARRVPLAYLTGRAGAYGLELDVGPGVFIPRPCTDGLIEWALDVLPDGGSACDVGTGSGSIAVALALHRPASPITAVDRSAEALAFARRNAAHLGARVAFVRGDLTSWCGARFDLIVSNPPYVDSPQDVSPEVLHEPPAALYAGLSVITRLAAEAPARLRPGGRLLLEFGFGQAEDVRRILRETGAFDAVEIRPDLEGTPRFAGASRC